MWHDFLSNKVVFNAHNVPIAITVHKVSLPYTQTGDFFVVVLYAQLSLHKTEVSLTYSAYNKLLFKMSLAFVVEIQSHISVVKLNERLWSPSKSTSTHSTISGIKTQWCRQVTVQRIHTNQLWHFSLSLPARVKWSHISRGVLCWTSAHWQDASQELAHLILMQMETGSQIWYISHSLKH